MGYSSHITNLVASEKVRVLPNDPFWLLDYPSSMENESKLHHLRAWRKFRKLTQEQLAESIDTTKSVISELESGRTQLSPKWLRKIAPVLQTSPGYILDHDPNDLNSDVLEIWANISDEDKETARRVLEGFLKRA